MTQVTAPTLEPVLTAALDAAGHSLAIWAHICRVPRRKSGWVLLAPGYVVHPTTARGQAAAYVGYRGAATDRVAHLQAYSATLARAGWTVTPILLRPDHSRCAWAWDRPDPPSGVRALLVTPQEAQG